MLGKDHCLELIETALAACECEQAEVILHREERALHAPGRIRDSSERGRNQRHASPFVPSSESASPPRRRTSLRPEAARDAARRALELAAVAAEDKDFHSLPKPEPLPNVNSYAAATAESTPEARAAAMAEVVAIARRENCLASGSLSVETSEIAIGNSLGIRAYAPTTQATFVTVIADDDSSGYADWSGTDLSQVRSPRRGRDRHPEVRRRPRRGARWNRACTR